MASSSPPDVPTAEMVKWRPLWLASAEEEPPWPVAQRLAPFRENKSVLCTWRPGLRHDQLHIRHSALCSDGCFFLLVFPLPRG